MRKTLLSVAALVATTHTIAQELTINSAPVVNSTFYYYDANVPNPPFTFSASGTGNTWDFTGITPVTGADDTLYVKAMSTSAGAAAAFPDGTYMDFEADTHNSRRVVKIASDGAYVLGAYGDIFGLGTEFALSFNQPEMYISFPSQLGTHLAGTGRVEQKFSGAAIGQPSVDSVWVIKTVHGDREMVATGNLVVPAGTFTALLERSVSTSYDTVYIKSATTGGVWTLAPGQPSMEQDSNFYWYNETSLIPYAHALYENGVLHDVNYFMSVTTDPVGIAGHVSAPKWSFYPNPVEDVARISGLPANSRFELFDFAGRNMGVLQATDGLIQFGELPRGIYLLKPIDKPDGGLHLVRK